MYFTESSYTNRVWYYVMQKISSRVFYGFPGVKTVANSRAASAPAEHLVIHRTIARKQKKINLKFRYFIGIFFVESTVKDDSNQPNFKPDRTTSFFGVVSLEKLCPICKIICYVYLRLKIWLAATEWREYICILFMDVYI